MAKDGPAIVIAKDIFQSIVEGKTHIVEELVAEAEKNQIFLVKIALCEGLKLAENITIEGLHALARLVSVNSGIGNFTDEKQEDFENKRTGAVTSDALLSSLVGAIGKNNYLDAINKLWQEGIVPTASDADVFAALLSVRDGDTLYPSTFSGWLEAVHLIRVDSPIEERKKWFVSEEYIEKLREKCMLSCE